MKRGRPPGSKNQAGHKAGRPKGTKDSGSSSAGTLGSYGFQAADAGTKALQAAPVAADAFSKDDSSAWVNAERQTEPKNTQTLTLESPPVVSTGVSAHSIRIFVPGTSEKKQMKFAAPATTKARVANVVDQQPGPATVASRPHPTTLRGIQNPSNYCFRNAVLQGLRSLPGFLEAVLSPELFQQLSRNWKQKKARHATGSGRLHAQSTRFLPAL